MQALKITLLHLFIVLSSFSVFSRDLISIPYFCGFEDKRENTKWVLNYGPLGKRCKDKWIIANGARNEGRFGLYISNDGYSAEYGSAPNIVVAYRDFTVSKKVRSEISFDWKSNGDEDATDLYVLLIRANESTPNSLPFNSTAFNSLSSLLRKYKAKALNQSSGWQNYQFQAVLQPNVDYRLLFIWVNTNKRRNLPDPVGACIDNLQITEAGCVKPTAFKAKAYCDYVQLSWEGTAKKYQLDYKLKEATKWTNMPAQEATAIYLKDLAKGLYDFRLRATCDDTFSAYALCSALLFCPDENSFNYTNLRDTTIVKAYHGQFGNPEQMQELLDYGADSKLSRHTINWIQNEFDPRTNDRLRTIPENEVVSVRLGNWGMGAQAESLHYTYLVDSVYNLLSLKYAVVLEVPDHEKEEQPRFLLQILNELGEPVDPVYGQADFHADRNGHDWNITKGDVTWKDWTIINIDLSKHIGKKLTIKLTTFDCKLKGHYGYAYFTLNFNPQKKPAGHNLFQPTNESPRFILHNLFFDVDKSTIKPESEFVIDDLYHFLSDNPDIFISIIGHTDNTATIEHNMKLSENRAKVVYDALIKKGINPSRLTYTGKGPNEPATTNETVEGRAENRRVEFIIKEN